MQMLIYISTGVAPIKSLSIALLLILTESRFNPTLLEDTVSGFYDIRIHANDDLTDNLTDTDAGGGWATTHLLT